MGHWVHRDSFCIAYSVCVAHLCFNDVIRHTGTIPHWVKVLLDQDEVSLLLNKPGSRLAYGWQRDNLMRWVSRMDADLVEYKPSRTIIKEASYVLLPGERCWRCKRSRSK